LNILSQRSPYKSVLQHLKSQNWRAVAAIRHCDDAQGGQRRANEPRAEGVEALAMEEASDRDGLR
jgi:hypothetical protein